MNTAIVAAEVHWNVLILGSSIRMNEPLSHQGEAKINGDHGFDGRLHLQRGAVPTSNKLKIMQLV
jgi:hypothetical protein